MSETPAKRRKTGGPEGGDRAALEAQVVRAREGSAQALEAVVTAIRPDIHHLAIRFLWHPQDAEDATQDILIRIVTGLGSFRGDSAFTTWCYRVAVNALISMKKTRAEDTAVSFDDFESDLMSGLSDEPLTHGPDVEESLLLEEVKIGCTAGMLLCLDRPHRLAYILGEILQVDHRAGAEVLDISRANYRKRLSRARAQITGVMRRQCGLFDPTNRCRCRRRVRRAVELGRVDPSRLLFASSRETARRFPQVLAEIRNLEELSRAAALYRSHPSSPPESDLVSWLRGILEREEPRLDLD